MEVGKSFCTSLVIYFKIKTMNSPELPLSNVIYKVNR
jgi:hypothetical protein